MSHASAQMQQYYAQRASYYDEVYLKPERQADIAWLRNYLPARLQGRHLLEIACGTGYWTQYLATTAASMTACDLTAEPLALARQRPGVAKVSFLQADAYRLPATLGDFDAAFAGLWFSHVPIAARQDFLAGLHRCLGAGARVIFIDNNHAQLRDFPLSERDEHGNSYQQRPLKDGSSHRVLKNFPTAAEMQTLLAPYASEVSYRELDNFWLCEYTLK